MQKEEDDDEDWGWAQIFNDTKWRVAVELKEGVQSIAQLIQVNLGLGI